MLVVANEVATVVDPFTPMRNRKVGQRRKKTLLLHEIKVLSASVSINLF